MAEDVKVEVREYIYWYILKGAPPEGADTPSGLRGVGVAGYVLGSSNVGVEFRTLGFSSDVGMNGCRNRNINACRCGGYTSGREQAISLGTQRWRMISVSQAPHVSRAGRCRCRGYFCSCETDGASR